MPKVSVIIPCYNQGHYLDEAIDSVLCQTYEDFEIIIINDGSTDEYTNAVLANYTRPKTRVIHTANQGVCRARNRAIEEAFGKFILPLDADDRIKETYLEKAIKVIDSDERIGIVYCLAEFFGERNDPWESPEYSLETLLVHNLIFCSALFRKADWSTVNGYNPNMRYGFEDWDLWLSIIELNRGVFRIPEVLFSYRIKSVSRTTLMNEERTLDMRVQLFHNHQQLYIDNIRNLLKRVAGSDAFFLNFEKFYYEAINSISWKVTRPFRSMVSLFQKKLRG